MDADRLREAYSLPQLPQNWLAWCIRQLRSADPGFDAWPEQRRAEAILTQFLYCDFNTSGQAGSLPPDVQMLHQQTLSGQHVLQLDEVINIAAAAKDRYRHHSASDCLKLILTDGKRRVVGIEYRNLPDLRWDCPAGCKVLVSNAFVRRGLLLLQPESFAILGGQVERLEQARQRAVACWNRPAVGRGRNAGPRDIFGEAQRAAWDEFQQPPTPGTLQLPPAQAAPNTQPQPQLQQRLATQQIQPQHALLHGTSVSHQPLTHVNLPPQQQQPPQPSTSHRQQPPQQMSYEQQQQPPPPRQMPGQQQLPHAGGLHSHTLQPNAELFPCQLLPTQATAAAPEATQPPPVQLTPHVPQPRQHPAYRQQQHPHALQQPLWPYKAPGTQQRGPHPKHVPSPEEGGDVDMGSPIEEPPYPLDPEGWPPATAGQRQQQQQARQRLAHTAERPGSNPLVYSVAGLGRAGTQANIEWGAPGTKPLQATALAAAGMQPPLPSPALQRPCQVSCAQMHGQDAEPKQPESQHPAAAVRASHPSLQLPQLHRSSSSLPVVRPLTEEQPASSTAPLQVRGAVAGALIGPGGGEPSDLNSQHPGVMQVAGREAMSHEGGPAVEDNGSGPDSQPMVIVISSDDETQGSRGEPDMELDVGHVDVADAGPTSPAEAVRPLLLGQGPHGTAVPVMFLCEGPDVPFVLHRLQGIRPVFAHLGLDAPVALALDLVMKRGQQAGQSWPLVLHVRGTLYEVYGSWPAWLAWVEDGTALVQAALGHQVLEGIIGVPVAQLHQLGGVEESLAAAARYLQNFQGVMELHFDQPPPLSSRDGGDSRAAVPTLLRAVDDGEGSAAVEAFLRCVNKKMQR